MPPRRSSCFAANQEQQWQGPPDPPLPLLPIEPETPLPGHLPAPSGAPRGCGQGCEHAAQALREGHAAGQGAPRSPLQEPGSAPEPERAPLPELAVPLSNLRLDIKPNFRAPAYLAALGVQPGLNTSACADALCDALRDA
ncbi:hypothetical protein PsYK624_164260 [Phanerochaete sordida]|uniref:Uncharacterized protein n=1 Tax=Phanerochaete sordida TaxID=48140 RepID=A0A9P3GS29_9APHY|nr:hypothetical protein PsYK624_164260 [Phanerochaete sordida]